MRPGALGLAFPAWRTDSEFIPLVELLLTVGPWITGRANWLLHINDYGTGWRGSEELNRLARQGERLPTLVLLDLVSDGIQVVDGDFYCFKDLSDDDFLKVSCVRGAAWDVHSTNDELLETVRRNYPAAIDIPA